MHLLAFPLNSQPAACTRLAKVDSAKGKVEQTDDRARQSRPLALVHALTHHFFPQVHCALVVDSRFFIPLSIFEALENISTQSESCCTLAHPAERERE